MSGTDALTKENIQRFAAAWFVALDVHAPVEEITRLLAEQDLVMVFPEQTLRGLDDFKAWYAGGRYSDGSSAPGVINLFFDENHNVQKVEPTVSGNQAEVGIVVGWQASWFQPPAAKSKRTSMNASQQWTVRPSTRNAYGLEIIRYNAVAKPFEYAPGFAQL
jgi:hypothetical protein